MTLEVKKTTTKKNPTFVDPYSMLCSHWKEALQPLWIMLPDDMDSWQNSVWRFIPFKQAKLMKNKLKHLCLYVVGNLQFFIFT